jgi:curved DNA-binding protein CbpA
MMLAVSPRTVEPKEARMKEWRELLRQWHPDKNPHRIEAGSPARLSGHVRAQQKA